MNKYSRKIPTVFVGGPWSKPDPEENIKQIVSLFVELWRDGKCFPICPMIEQHLIHSRYQLIDYEHGLQRCFEFIDSSHAAIFRAGESSGKVREKIRFSEKNIIVFENKEVQESKKQLYQWIETSWMNSKEAT